MAAGDDPATRSGWVSPHVAGEFPGLGISWIEVERRPGRSGEPVRHRLREVSGRFYGADAVQMRERPIPWAYRVFFRQIGLDPDRTRTPIEQLALQRLRDGGFKSRGLPDDALTIGTIETGVALRAFDAERIEGALGIRESAPGESLPGQPGKLSQGTLVIADDLAPAALLFGAAGEGREVGKGTVRMTIAAIQVGSVPELAVGEALWLASSVLQS